MNKVLEVFGNVDTVGVAGDWHMDTQGAINAIGKFNEAGIKVILHVGDFGVFGGPSGAKYLRHVNKLMVGFDMFIFVTLGNHEDYGKVSKFLPVEGMDGCVFMPDHERIIYFSRGFNWDWNGNRFMSVGGASSIDYKMRTVNQSWWAEEMISDEDVDSSIKAGKVDVMITHDVPYGVEMFENKPSAVLTMDVQIYADKSRKQLKRITDVTQPKMLIHGHYHEYRNKMDEMRIDGEYEFYYTNHICLDREFSKFNTGTVNTETLEFRIL